MARLGAATTVVSSDATLAAMAPGGVYSRSAPSGVAYPFLTLSLVRLDSDYTMTGPYRHKFRYNLTASDESDAIDGASAALQRAYELLQDAPASLMVMEDFTLGFCRRYGRVGTTPTNAGVTYQRIMDEWRLEVFPL